MPYRIAYEGAGTAALTRPNASDALDFAKRTQEAGFRIISITDIKTGTVYDLMGFEEAFRGREG